MSTQKETVEFILQKLDMPEIFSVRKMFGEYALYVHPAKGGAGPKVVGLICDDQPSHKATMGRRNKKKVKK